MLEGMSSTHSFFRYLCAKLMLLSHRFHSGAQPITPVVTTAVSTSAFTAAIKEYEDNTDTETDGEDGDE